MRPGGTLTSESTSQDPGEEGTPARGNIPTTQRAFPTARMAISVSLEMLRTAHCATGNQPSVPFPPRPPSPLHSHTTQKMWGHLNAS